MRNIVFVKKKKRDIFLWKEKIILLIHTCSMKKLIRKKQLSSVKPGEKSFRKKEKNVFVFFLPGESFYWNKSLGRRNLQEKEVGFFSRRNWENQVKKNVFKFEKKNRGKMYVRIFSQIKFLFLSRKKCKLLFLLLENSLYLKQSF